MADQPEYLGFGQEQDQFADLSGVDDEDVFDLRRAVPLTPRSRRQRERTLEALENSVISQVRSDLDDRDSVDEGDDDSDSLEHQDFQPPQQQQHARHNSKSNIINNSEAGDDGSQEHESSEMSLGFLSRILEQLPAGGGRGGHRSKPQQPAALGSPYGLDLRTPRGRLEDLDDSQAHSSVQLHGSNLLVDLRSHAGGDTSAASASPGGIGPLSPLAFDGDSLSQANQGRPTDRSFANALEISVLPSKLSSVSPGSPSVATTAAAENHTPVPMGTRKRPWSSRKVVPSSSSQPRSAGKPPPRQAQAGPQDSSQPEQEQQEPEHPQNGLLRPPHLPTNQASAADPANDSSFAGVSALLSPMAIAGSSPRFLAGTAPASASSTGSVAARKVRRLHEHELSIEEKVLQRAVRLQTEVDRLSSLNADQEAQIKAQREQIESLLDQVDQLQLQLQAAQSNEASQPSSSSSPSSSSWSPPSSSSSSSSSLHSEDGGADQSSRSETDVRALLSLVEEQRTRIDGLQSENADLRTQVAELVLQRERVGAGSWDAEATEEEQKRSVERDDTAVAATQLDPELLEMLAAVQDGHLGGFADPRVASVVEAQAATLEQRLDTERGLREENARLRDEIADLTQQLEARARDESAAIDGHSSGSEDDDGHDNDDIDDGDQNRVRGRKQGQRRRMDESSVVSEEYRDWQAELDALQNALDRREADAERLEARVEELEQQLSEQASDDDRRADAGVDSQLLLEEERDRAQALETELEAVRGKQAEQAEQAKELESTREQLQRLEEAELCARAELEQAAQLQARLEHSHAQQLEQLRLELETARAEVAALREQLQLVQREAQAVGELELEVSQAQLKQQAEDLNRSWAAAVVQRHESKADLDEEDVADGQVRRETVAEGAQEDTEFRGAFQLSSAASSGNQARVVGVVDAGATPQELVERCAGLEAQLEQVRAEAETLAQASTELRAQLGDATQARTELEQQRDRLLAELAQQRAALEQQLDEARLQETQRMQQSEEIWRNRESSWSLERTRLQAGLDETRQQLETLRTEINSRSAVSPTPSAELGGTARLQLEVEQARSRAQHAEEMSRGWLAELNTLRQSLAQRDGTVESLRRQLELLQRQPQASQQVSQDLQLRLRDAEAQVSALRTELERVRSGLSHNFGLYPQQQQPQQPGQSQQYSASPQDAGFIRLEQALASVSALGERLAELVMVLRGSLHGPAPGSDPGFLSSPNNIPLGSQRASTGAFGLGVGGSGLGNSGAHLYDRDLLLRELHSSEERRRQLEHELRVLRMDLAQLSRSSAKLAQEHARLSARASGVPLSPDFGAGLGLGLGLDDGAGARGWDRMAGRSGDAGEGSAGLTAVRQDIRDIQALLEQLLAESRRPGSDRSSSSGSGGNASSMNHNHCDNCSNCSHHGNNRYAAAGGRSLGSCGCAAHHGSAAQAALIADLRDQLAELERQRDRLQAELRQARSDHQREMERELERQRRDLTERAESRERELESQVAGLRQERTELRRTGARLETDLRERLSKYARLREAYVYRNEVLARLGASLQQYLGELDERQRQAHIERMQRLVKLMER